MSKYSDKFKQAMVSKLTAPGAINAGSLAPEVGISQSTLSRWVREYVNMNGKGVTMKEKSISRDGCVTGAQKKSRGYLGGSRGREIGLEDRKMCIELVKEAVESGARRKQACEMLEISLRTLQRWEFWSRG